MNAIFRDLKFGLKMLKKSPGFTLIAVLTIGLGIGANTTIFSVFNAFVFRPLPYENAGRLVYIPKHSESQSFTSISYPDYLDWREQTQSFADIGCIKSNQSNMTGLDMPERVQETWVSANFFEILGVNPALGRLFSEDDDQPGERTVILSHAFWQQRFGGNEDVIGRTITLDSNAHTVIGVMPEGFNFPPYGFERSDMWTPIGLRRGEEWLMERSTRPGIHAFGLLQETMSISRAQEDMSRVTKALEEQYPESNTGVGARVIDAQEWLSENIRPVLFTLVLCVMFVLLIACANVANLLLTRATARQHEIAIRTAMGGSRRELLRQSCCESFLLSALGAITGVILTQWGLSGVVLMLPEDKFWAAKSMLAIDTNVLIYVLALTVVVTFVFGIIPTLQSSKTNLNELLKDAGRSLSIGKKRLRLRNLITESQIALAFVLLIGSGLTVRSMVEVLKTDLGYNPKNVLVMDMNLTGEKYNADASVRAFYRNLIAEMESLPGVESASAAFPLLGGWQNTYQVEGEPILPSGQRQSAEFKQVTDGYKDVMGITLVKGRFFNEQDTQDSVKVAIVDEKFVDLHWRDENPIGKRIRRGSGAGNTSEWFEVVGVIKPIKYYGIEKEARQEVLLPMEQLTNRNVTIALRTDVDPLSVVSAARSAVFRLDSSLPVSNVTTTEDIVAGQTYAKAVLSTFLGVFAGIALLLSLIGIYGVVAYSVMQRTREFGVRMALGSTVSGVFHIVIKQGFRLVMIGLAFGLLVSIWVAYLLSSQLYNVSIYDPATYIVVALMLMAVALFACLLPAWRASCIDPVHALRYE